MKSISSLFCSEEIPDMEAASSWDRIARELSDEWCGMEPDREETSLQRGREPGDELGG